MITIAKNGQEVNIELHFCEPPGMSQVYNSIFNKMKAFLKEKYGDEGESVKVGFATEENLQFSDIETLFSEFPEKDILGKICSHCNLRIEIAGYNMITGHVIRITVTKEQFLQETPK